MGIKQGLTMRIMTNSFVGITQEGYNWFIKKKEGDGGWVLGFIKRCWSERWWSENDRLWLVRNGNNHEGMGRSKQDKKIKVKSEWWQRSWWLCVKLRDEWWKKRFDEKTRMCIRRDGLPRLQFFIVTNYDFIIVLASGLSQSRNACISYCNKIQLHLPLISLNRTIINT